MSVRKDPRSPYWQYDFQRNRQRFHGSTGCTTRRDAERFEAELKRKVALGDDTKPAVTLDQACEAYWQDKGQHEKNYKTTEYQMANLCSLIGGNRMLANIRTTDIRAFIARRRGQEVSNASVNRELGVARRVWKHALSGGFDVPIPGTEHAIDWSKLMLAEPKERVRELSDDEETRLFAHLSDDLAAVVRFALMSGQRRSAVIGLRWDRIDLATMRAEVWTKGDKWHRFPLTLTMVEALLEQPVVDDCPFVFTYLCRRPAPARPDRPRRVKGVRYPFSPEGWKREWGRALTAAGITDFRFHDLRHTRATRVVRSSGNMKAAQRLLGHTDISTTARYAHVMDDDLRGIMTGAESRNSHGAHLREGARTATETLENDDGE